MLTLNDIGTIAAIILGALGIFLHFKRERRESRKDRVHLSVQLSFARSQSTEEMVRIHVINTGHRVAVLNDSVSVALTEVTTSFWLFKHYGKKWHLSCVDVVSTSNTYPITLEPDEEFEEWVPCIDIWDEIKERRYPRRYPLVAFATDRAGRLFASNPLKFPTDEFDS